MKKDQQIGFVRLIVLVLSALAVLVGAFFLTNIGSFQLDGTTTTETPTVADFTGIDLSGAMTVLLEAGNQHAVSINLDEALRDRLQVEVKDNVLTIGFLGLDYIRSLKIKPNDITITITAPNLASVEASGHVVFASGSKLEADTVKVSLTGKIEGSLSFIANTLNLQTDGQTKLMLLGSVFDEFNLTTNGTAQIEAENLATPAVEAKSNGNITIHIGTKRTVNFMSNGLATVTYDQPPTDITVTGRGQYNMVNRDDFDPKESLTNEEA